MASNKSLLVLAALFAAFLFISSEVSARDLAEQTQEKTTKVAEGIVDQKGYGGGGYGRGGGGYGGGGYGHGGGGYGGGGGGYGHGGGGYGHGGGGYGHGGGGYGHGGGGYHRHCPPYCPEADNIPETEPNN